MEEKILVPILGESITEATVSKWLKKEGDNVDAEEPLVELETDKVNLEVPSPVSGVLKKINSKDGTTVEVGALLGLVVESADPLEKIEKIQKIKSTTKKDNVIELDREKEKKEEPKIFDKISNEIEEKEKPLVLTKEIKEDKPLGDDNKNQNLSPAVRKMVAENKIDINSIEGSGKDGRVLKGDLINLMGVDPPASDRKLKYGQEERIKMTRLRQTIAKRLKQAQTMQLF